MPKASPKSKTFKKGASTSAENNGQKPLIEKCGRTVENCQGPGREHVAALLAISEERSALELGPYDSPGESGWDETVSDELLNRQMRKWESDIRWGGGHNIIHFQCT